MVRQRIRNFNTKMSKSIVLPSEVVTYFGLIVGLTVALTTLNAGQMIEPINNYFTKMLELILKALPILVAISISASFIKKHKVMAVFSVIITMIMTYGYIEITYLSNGAEMTMSQSLLIGVFSALYIILVDKVNLIKVKSKQINDIINDQKVILYITIFTIPLISVLIPIALLAISLLIGWITSLLDVLNYFAYFIYGFIERILITTGLHHIFNFLFRFTELGGTEVINGETINGSLNIFYHQLISGAQISPENSAEYTAYLSQGKIPSINFGLPAAALAMYHAIEKDQRSKYKKRFLIAIFSAVLFGISEPIEFMFLFTAPILFLMHAMLNGLSYMLLALLQVSVGGADCGLMDVFVFGILQGLQTKWYLVVVLGVIYALIYYLMFSFAIKKFNLKTPGRNKEKSQINVDEFDEINAKNLLEALGGKENIISFTHCMTRLRIEVAHSNVVNIEQIKALCAIEVIIMDEINVQVIYGPNVKKVYNEVNEILKQEHKKIFS